VIKFFLGEPFAFVPRGSFMMGSYQGFPLELPVHYEEIRRDFFLGVYPVTQRLWQTVNGNNPATFQMGDAWPIENIDWHDACEFCRKFGSLIGETVRLPMEAEWEYACRAGSTTEYFWGSESRSAREYAWFDINSIDSTQPVGTKNANPWGLYDMAGNVWEWCVDLWRDNYAAEPDETKSSDGMNSRVIRGGAWDMDVFRCRSAYRSCEGEYISSKKIGLRLLIEIR
jgi:formylglycine-generating enzyme required for sulfatase activity